MSVASTHYGRWPLLSASDPATTFRLRGHLTHNLLQTLIGRRPSQGAPAARVAIKGLSGAAGDSKRGTRVHRAAQLSRSARVKGAPWLPGRAIFILI
eukprot:5865742-Pyramimonas_sp.AAC.2